MLDKIPYAIVELEVVKLYERGYHLTETDDIVKHFDFITAFIQSCGWTTDDYTAHQFGWNELFN